MNEQKKPKNIGAGAIIKAVLFGVILFFILIFAGALIFSAFMIKSSYVKTVFYIILFLCAFLTGLKSSSGYNKKGYLRGIASGILYILILAAVFKFIDKPLTSKTYVTYIISLLLSTAGGIAGMSSK